MTSSIAEYGLPVAATIVMALIIWGPTVAVFLRRRQRDQALTPACLGIVMFAEFAVLLTIAAIANFTGLQDAGGYLLAIALVIGALGPQALKFTGSRRGGSIYRRCSIQPRTEARASGSFAASLPPACAMSGLPPPLPPTCCAT